MHQIQFSTQFSSQTQNDQILFSSYKASWCIDIDWQRRIQGCQTGATLFWSQFKCHFSSLTSWSIRWEKANLWTKDIPPYLAKVFRINNHDASLCRKVRPCTTSLCIFSPFLALRKTRNQWPASRRSLRRGAPCVAGHLLVIFWKLSWKQILFNNSFSFLSTHIDLKYLVYNNDRFKVRWENWFWTTFVRFLGASCATLHSATRIFATLFPSKRVLPPISRHIGMTF